MPSHNHHPQIEAYGLADDCPRCSEIAADPFRGLDSANLWALVSRTGQWMHDSTFPRCETEAVAMRVVEQAIVRARQLHRAGFDFRAFHARADVVKVTSDEDGHELHVTTDGGDTYVFNIQAVAWEFAADVDREIGAEYREAMAIKREVEEAKTAAAIHAVTDPPDDDDPNIGYDRSDPKHGNWHSIHSEVWDNRDKTEHSVHVDSELHGEKP